MIVEDPKHPVLKKPPVKYDDCKANCIHYAGRTPPVPQDNPDVTVCHFGYGARYIKVDDYGFVTNCPNNGIVPKGETVKEPEMEECRYGGLMNENLNFGEVFELAKKGRGMRLPQWNADVIIRARYPDKNSKMTAPYLYVESRFGKVPWKETMIELFSEEWVSVE